MLGNKVKRESTNNIRSTLRISVVVLLGKVLGFVKQAVVAWAFGSGNMTDVYFSTDGYTTFMSQIFNRSVGPTVLTKYIRECEVSGEDSSEKLINQSFVFFGMLGLLATLVSIIFSQQLSNVLGLAYSDEQKLAIRSFLIVKSPVIVIAPIVGVCAAFLDGNKKFVPNKMASLFVSVFSILIVILFRRKIGVWSLAVGAVVGYLSHFVFMVANVLKKHHFRFENPFGDATFSHVIKAFTPILIGSAAVDLSHLIDTVIASALPNGSVSVLYYAQVASANLVSAVVVSSIGTVLLTSFSKTFIREKDKYVLCQHIQKMLTIMSLVMFLITALYVVSGFDLVRVFYERGEFNPETTKEVYIITIAYALGFVFMGIREILVQAHYAFHDSFSPMVNTIVGVIVNISLSILFSWKIGIIGIAVATSISLLIVSVMSAITIQKHIKCSIFQVDYWLNELKIIIAMVASIFGGKFFSETFANLDSRVRLILLSVLLSIIFVICLLVLNETTTKKVLNRFWGIKLKNE